LAIIVRTGVKLKRDHPFRSQNTFIRGYITEVGISAKEHGYRVWVMGVYVVLGWVAWHGMLGEEMRS
jgi:hypothetical protein